MSLNDDAWGQSSKLPNKEGLNAQIWQFLLYCRKEVAFIIYITVSGADKPPNSTEYFRLL